MFAATPLISWVTLGYIVMYSSIIGVGIVGLFSAGVFALSQVRSKDASLSKRITGYTTLLACNAVIIVILVWGLSVMLHKS